MHFMGAFHVAEFFHLLLSETASLKVLRRLLTFCKRIKPLLRATIANQLVGVAPSSEYILIESLVICPSNLVFLIESFVTCTLNLVYLQLYFLEQPPHEK